MTTGLETATNYYPEAMTIRAINSSKAELLQKVFDADLSQFTFPEGRPGTTPLFGTLEKYALDGGLGKRREFFPPQEEPTSEDLVGVERKPPQEEPTSEDLVGVERKPLVAEPVDMFNRPAFIHVAIERMKKEGFNGSFYIMDIARLRDADLAKDKNGNKAADYMLNRIAQLTQDEIAEIQKETGAVIDVGRYGGDEFMFLIDGVDQDVRQQVFERIAQKIQKIEGYFAQYDEHSAEQSKSSREQLQEVVKKDVRLKTMKEIVIPRDTDGIDSVIFQYYLRKGLILEPDDIEKVKEKPEDVKRIQESSDRSIYPADLIPDALPEEEQLQLKIDYITKHHPELNFPFLLAASVNEAGGQKALLAYVENVMYDRMLNEVVLGFTDMGEHIMNGEYKEVVMFDLKFIKEINDVMSVVEGDKAIVQLWEDIQKVIDKEAGPKKYQIYRRGGTFAIAFTESQPALKSRLASLENNEIRWNGTAIPIGYTEWDLQELNQDTAMNRAAINGQTEVNDKINNQDLVNNDAVIQKKEKMLREYMDPVFQNLNDNWQAKIGDYIYANIEATAMDPRRFISKKLLHKDDLIVLYYSGIKRGIERTNAALKYYLGQRSNNDGQPDTKKNNALYTYFVNMSTVVMQKIRLEDQKIS